MGLTDGSWCVCVCESECVCVCVCVCVGGCVRAQLVRGVLNKPSETVQEKKRGGGGNHQRPHQRLRGDVVLKNKNGLWSSGLGLVISGMARFSVEPSHGVGSVMV